MTGGRAVILGPTGRNFAAGMSGGIAYIWDEHGDFNSKCNMGTVDLDPVDAEEDAVELRDLIEQHKEYTGSKQAEQILDAWPDVLNQFVKVMPTDYKRVLAERKKHDEEMEAAIHDDQSGEYSVMSD
jgi:glutamate synthase domain-containing protein 3